MSAGSASWCGRAAACGSPPACSIRQSIGSGRCSTIPPSAWSPWPPPSLPCRRGGRRPPHAVGVRRRLRRRGPRPDPDPHRGDDARLLLPLYGVLAAGALATLYEVLRGGGIPLRVGPVARALAVLLALSAVSLLWSVDAHQGAVDMLFFYLPFGFMTVRVAQLGWSAAGLRAAFVAQVALALIFAAVGLWQEAVHRVFWNPGVETSNAYRSFFRVNSLFWDASVYGRFLAVTLILLAGVAVYRGLTPAVVVTIVPSGRGSTSRTRSRATWRWPPGRSRSAPACGRGASLWASSPWARWRLWASLRWRCRDGARSRASLTSHLGRHPPPSLGGGGGGGGGGAAMAATEHPYRLGGASHTTPVAVAAEVGPLGRWPHGRPGRARLGRGGGPARARRLRPLAALVAIFASSSSTTRSSRMRRSG